MCCGVYLPCWRRFVTQHDAEQQLTLWSEYVPWASHAAQECEFLLVVPYEELLELPLEEVRRRLNFCPAPAVEA